MKSGCPQSNKCLTKNNVCKWNYEICQCAFMQVGSTYSNFKMRNIMIIVHLKEKRWNQNKIALIEVKGQTY